MIYAYIRVSSDKQTVENQRFEIKAYCKKRDMIVNRWFEETISGVKDVQKRELGKLIKKMKPKDIMLCTELSRLGRNLLMIMGVLNYCMEQDIQIWTIRDNYRLGDDISSKVLAFAFGLSAEIERTLLSQRVTEALARKRAEGVILGRPKGRKSSVVKLTGREEEIKKLLKKGHTKSAVARIMRVNRNTLYRFIDENNLVVLGRYKMWTDYRIAKSEKRKQEEQEMRKEVENID